MNYSRPVAVSQASRSPRKAGGKPSGQGVPARHRAIATPLTPNPVLCQDRKAWAPPDRLPAPCWPRCGTHVCPRVSAQAMAAAGTLLGRRGGRLPGQKGRSLTGRTWQFLGPSGAPRQGPARTQACVQEGLPGDAMCPCHMRPRRTLSRHHPLSPRGHGFAQGPPPLLGPPRAPASSPRGPHVQHSPGSRGAGVGGNAVMKQ